MARLGAILLLAIALFVCDEVLARAQVPPRAPLLAKLALRYRRARSGAPLPIVWKFDWPERVVARGALEYEVYDEQTRLGEFRIPDFVLSPGKNEFNALLPAVFVNSSATLLTVHGRFVTSGRSLDFEEQTLRVPTLSVQWFSVGVIAGARAATPESEMQFLDKIRLETFLPPNEAQNQSATVAYDVKAADLPSDPLTLCNFDVLVLTPPALAELREDQAGAVRKWVRAGGSLCVITGSGLEPRHAELLNDLTSESRRAKFVVGPKGFLLPDEDPPEMVLRVPKSLGRVAVLRAKLLETIVPDGATWLETANFLLKGRRNKQPGWDADSQFLQANNRRAARGAPSRTPPIMIPPGRASRFRGPNSWVGSLNAAPLGHLDELYELLMPLGVSTIPLGVIALILAAYIATIGPIDYFLLGALRLRRFTWVLFPVVTIGFAAYTLWLSQRYLGSTDSRRAIEIYDFAPDGAVARRTRIEMLFLSQENTVATQIDNGLYSLVGRGIVMSRGPVPNAALRPTSESVGVQERFPSSYQIVEQIPQWQPVLNRFFWIDPKPSAIYQPPGLPGAAGFNWDLAHDLTVSPGGVSLAERVRRAFGPDACAIVLRGPAMVYVLNDLKELKHWKANSARTGTNPFGVNSLTETVRELCQRTPEQVFKYTSNLSPNGGPELDDLAIADSTDPDQAVLVIAVETNSTLHLYRRGLFRESVMLVVNIENLYVDYGNIHAVRGISLQIPRGEVYGFIGPNGAGKSSTIKVLATLLPGYRGRAQVNGVEVSRDPQAVRENIGYMPDFFGVYEDLTAREYLHFFAATYRIPRGRRAAIVNDVLELTDLTHKIDSQVDSLSRGMKQRLALARVLLHDPDLLLLDEPASGLDPRARIEVRELLKELKNMGKTILISSHILHELAQMCTRIGIIEAGQMVAQGPLDEIYRRLQLMRVVHLQLAYAGDEMLERLRGIPGVESVDQQVDRIAIRLHEDRLSVEDLHDAIHGLGGRIRMYQPEAMDMETAFMKLTQGTTA